MDSRFQNLEYYWFLDLGHFFRTLQQINKFRHFNLQAFITTFQAAFQLDFAILLPAVKDKICDVQF